MDLIEDEPRKQPKPVPFCQDSLIGPVVPEVSLILENNIDTQSKKRNDSFSGTEFQTYNAWRWKHMNVLEKDKGSPESRAPNTCTNIKDCCLIRDKYSFSDIEKRKNEILYGDMEEPRRPLPPRSSPVIPKCPEIFSMSSAFDDLKLSCEDVRDTHSKIPTSSSNFNQIKNEASSFSKLQTIRSEIDNSDKLYNIISEQNKQAEVLQMQIQQLLKLQEVKDKQIEQLLKSQESKEKKIEQILQSLELKDKEVEQLLRLKEKQEQQIQDLLKSEEKKQRENFELMRKLNEKEIKEVHTVGVMANVQLIEANTNTSFEYCSKQCCNKQSGNASGENMSVLRDLNETSEPDGRDKSISLHSADLPVIQEQVPTPQSSIHVDIQDFNDSSEESDDDLATLSNFPPSSEALSNKLGYTFYNNVLTQVKDIIHNSGEKDAKKNLAGSSGPDPQLTNRPLNEYNYVREKREAVQSFEAWGVCERENIPPAVNEERNHYIQRIPPEPLNHCVKDTYSPSDISLKINALALKYLKQEQISQYNVQPQVSTPRHPDVTIYNVTNLSFGSMRYLDRYRILPGVKENHHQETNMQKINTSPAQLLQRKKKMSVQENLNPSLGNILDISTLNQQPKLL